MILRSSICTAALLLLAAACNTGTQAAAPQIVATTLDLRACQKQPDSSDPNETPFWNCPGAAGYRLHVRRAGSGRMSIDVLSPSGREFPLDFTATAVTSAMFSLKDRAEWFLPSAGAPPLALIVHVDLREDLQDPARVTRTLAVIARLNPEPACVTRTLPAGDAAAIRQASEAARKDRCLSEPSNHKE